MRKGDILELKIDRVAQGGHGVARVDGFVVFVKGAVPGDTVNALVTKKKKDFAEARVVEVVDPSPERVHPPCPYFGSCGGCQWQNVRYAGQLEYKKALIEEALARIGGISGIPIHNPIGSEKIFGYRNKMEFSFSDRAWVMQGHPPPPLHPLPRGEGKRQGLYGLVRGAGGGETLAEPPRKSEFALGLHVPGSFHKVLDVKACLLQDAKGNEILEAVRDFAAGSGLPPYNLKTHEGFWRFLTLRRSVFYKMWMVNLVTAQYRRDIVEPLARHLTATFSEVGTVVNNVTDRHAAIAVGEWEALLTGKGFIEDRIGPYSFQVSANSFFQTNTPAAASLYQTVLDYAELTGSENVLDLYSGTGTIPIFVSSRSNSVMGMEISESAVEDARKNCRTNGIDNCRFILGDIRGGLSDLPLRPDVLILDPPRAGMHKDVVSGILDLARERIVYVSCNPATMARDLSELKAAYEVLEIQPVDMFPHTHHVESVAKLRRRSK